MGRPVPGGRLVSVTGDPRRDKDVIRELVEVARNRSATFPYARKGDGGLYLGVEGWANLAGALDRLTARLQTLEQALGELVEAYDEWYYAGTSVTMRTGRERHEDAHRAARAVVLEGRPENKGSGGLRSRPCESSGGEQL